MPRCSTLVFFSSGFGIVCVGVFMFVWERDRERESARARARARECEKYVNKCVGQYILQKLPS